MPVNGAKCRTSAGNLSHEFSSGQNLATADERNDFNSVARLQLALIVNFARNHFKVSFNRTEAIIDFQLGQKIGNGRVFVNLLFFAIDMNGNHRDAFVCVNVSLNHANCLTQPAKFI